MSGSSGRSPTATPHASTGSDADRPARVGVGLVVLGALLFTVNAGVSRIALRAGIDPATLTTIRVTGTVLVLALVAALLRPSALRLPRGRELRLVLAQGAIGVAALQWTYFVALDRLPVGMALLLEYQAPILVALWARFILKEQVRPRLWLGLGLAVVGLAAATGVGSGLSFDVLGILAGLGAAVCFASYFLIGDVALETMDAVRLFFWSFLVAAIGMNLAAPLTALDAVDLGSSVSFLGTLSSGRAPLWLVLVWIVILGTVIPFFAELAALRYVPPTVVTTIAMLEPIGVSALGWAWFRESLSPVAIVGCVLVVAGIIVAQSARTASATNFLPPDI